LVVVRGTQVVVEAGDEGTRLPEGRTLAGLSGPQVYLGELGDRSVFGAPLLRAAQLPEGFSLAQARLVVAGLDPALVAAVGQALALVEWDTMHRYCGSCAVPTELVAGERARRCRSCKFLFYPRISPAVIVLVEREGQILLARGVNSVPGRFSLVAGFVEPGEALEQAAVREVREEVGVEIADLRYWGSQPWPFGRSLMVGFKAKYVGGEIRVDGKEIAEANWFSPDNLPNLPGPISIARKMINHYLATHTPGAAL
jgi:NAD+ diphosphatase